MHAHVRKLTRSSHDALVSDIFKHWKFFPKSFHFKMPRGSKRKHPEQGVISQEELRAKATKLENYMSTSKQTSK